MRKYVFLSALLVSVCLMCLPAIGVYGAEAPQMGGDLVALGRTFEHLNAAITSGINTGFPAAQIFASLLRFDNKFQPLPYLAERWEVSRDGLTYTFHLVKNAKFHDGKPVTSQDVAFSLDIVKNNHPFGVAMFKAVDRVETPDPNTAVFKLNTPNPALLASLSPVLLPILPKHVYGTTGPIRTNPANNKPVGAGPFKFGEYKPGEYLILVRNDDYFIPGRPYLNRVIVNLIKDPSAMVVAIERGQANYWPNATINYQDVARLAKLDNLVATQDGNEAIGPIAWLAFNLLKPPMSDVRVRKAIAYAIDRTFITQNLQKGLSRPATGPIHHSSPYYTDEVNKYGLDPDKANKLLDEAGYPRKGDVRFSVTLDWEPGAIDRTVAVAEYFKAALKKVGIDLQLRTSPDYPTWANRVSNFEYDLTLDTLYNYPDPVIGVHRTYLSSNIKKGVANTNTMNYRNPKVDELLAKAAVETDFGKRKALYAEFQGIITDELPVFPLYEVAYYTLYSKKLGNPPLTVWGAMSPFDDVYLNK